MTSRESVPRLASRVFLSYGRGDDVEPFDPTTSFLARLHRDLTVAGFEVWFDRVSMPSRRLTFHQEIRDAVAAADRIVVVVGPHAIRSDYVRQEWLFALEADKVVTPILRLGDYPLVPGELGGLHCEDFRDDAQYGFHLANLIRILNEPIPPMGRLLDVPAPPAHFLPRPDWVDLLVASLRADLDRPVVLSGVTTRVGLHGMGGIGKSVLAAAVARDRRIREAFPDGIVWLTVGQTPSIPSLQRRAHQALGGDGAFADNQGRNALAALVAERAVLLILDDVWNRLDVNAFDVLGPRCRTLITTRDAGMLESLGGPRHVLELLTDDEAVLLLALSAGVAAEALPGEAGAILAECDRLPLAIALCGGMVQGGLPWRDVLEALRAHELEFIADEHVADARHRSIWTAMEVSVGALDEEARRRWGELAVFPHDEPVPEAAVLTLWRHTGGLDARHARQLLVRLRQRSLLQYETEVTTARVSLHDLLHDFAGRLANDVLRLHDQLLEAYHRQCPNGWSSGPDDGYFLSHLTFHGEKAVRADFLREMICEFDLLVRLDKHHCRLPVAEANLVRLHEQGLDNDRRIQNLAGNLDDFRNCLSFLRWLKADPKAVCTECGERGILHDHTDTGGCDYVDNYSVVCRNCYWAWFELNREYEGKNPFAFDYSTNTYRPEAG